MDGGRPNAFSDWDTVLMMRVRAGCAESFRLLVERHWHTVARLLARRVRSSAVAEELAQETFLRVYLARFRYAPDGRFTAWLFRIAANLAWNWLRDQRARQGREAVLDLGAMIADSRPDAEYRLIEAGRRNELRGAVRRLPRRQRKAVFLHKFEELQYFQVANAMGCSESAVKSLLNRAYSQLREELAARSRA